MRNRKIESHNIHIDSDYINWITELKQRYRSAQVKAVIKVNAEKLQFNWLLGRDLVRKKAEERWGSGVVERLSLDLRREFPDADGFSVSNLWFMKKWYCFYTQKEAVQKLQRPVAELESEKLQQPVREFDEAKSSRLDREKLQRPVREFEKTKLHQVGAEMPAFFAGVPWGHHIAIITKCKSVDEALFYIIKTVEQGMSRAALINCIKADLFSHQGKIVNNFTEKLPDLQSKLVQDVLKENYDFGFATVGHEIYDEAELEEALTKNVTDLLLEMGTGFAFIGRQKEVLVGGRSRKIDLLFYHIRLRCFVACELKAKPFEPEFVGKLNFYVNAIDELLKAPEDNPTIGLLICSNMDSTDVQWSFRGLGTPMGVATYNNIRIKDALPSKELLEERMRLLQKEMHTTKRLIRKKGE
ncbi:PDDEXK nuclease domain-containing protein [Fibrobacter sp.]